MINNTAKLFQKKEIKSNHGFQCIYILEKIDMLLVTLSYNEVKNMSNKVIW